MSLRAIANALLSALIAPPCAVCESVLDRPLSGAVCDRCWAAIVPRSSDFTLAAIARARAVAPYEGILRDVVHALKYDGRRSIAPPLASLMAAQGRAILDGADFVIPVPLHQRRRRERGFNQAEDLARGLGVPVLDALRRVKATHPQVDLPADRRRTNVDGAFDIRWRGRSELRPLATLTLVLVDDVTTTGATLEACAAALKQAGAAEIRALTAARVVSGPR